MNRLTSLFSVIALLAAAGITRADDAKELVTASLLADTTAMHAGEAFRIGVLLQIAPQWHVYWTNPGEGGIPTTVDLKLPEGFTVSAWSYPSPSKFPLGEGQVAFGYEDEVMLIAVVTPPAGLTGKDVSIAATANWMVCKDICKLGKADLSLTLPVGEADRANAELFDKWISQIPRALIEAPAIKSFDQSSDVAQWSATVTWTDAPPDDVQWFPPANDAVTFDHIIIEKLGAQTRIIAKVSVLAGQKLPDALGDSVLSFRSADGARLSVNVPLKWKPALGP